MTVAEFVTKHVRLSGKTEAEIAQDLGYESPNSIYMLMNGSIRIPMSKVKLLAESLEIDPVQLLQKVMGEYMPETLAALQSVLEGLSLTESERELICAYRRVASDRDVSAVICDKTVIAVVMLN